MTRYGYARVSTKDQRLDRQIEALVNAGVAYGHIYKDKVTGAPGRRPDAAEAPVQEDAGGRRGGGRILGALDQIDQAAAQL